MSRKRLLEGNLTLLRVVHKTGPLCITYNCWKLIGFDEKIWTGNLPFGTNCTELTVRYKTTSTLSDMS